MTASPVFIVGSGRCGTTPLRLMLNAHSGLYCGPEDHVAILHLHEWCRWRKSPDVFVRELFRYLTSYKVPLVRIWGIEDLRERVMSAVAAAPLDVGAWLDAVHRIIMERAAPTKRRWCLKTPHYVFHLPLLERLFPDLRVVHLVRDGRDVVHSFLSSALRWRMEPPNYAYGAYFWRDCNRAGDRFARAHPRKYLRVRYEDLVRRPAAVLGTICDFIGEPYEETMLRFHETNRRLRLIPAAEQRWHAKTAEPLDAENVERWKINLAEEEKRTFETLAGRMLREYGYETPYLDRGIGRAARLRMEILAVSFRWRERRRQLGWDLQVARRELRRALIGERPTDAAM